MKRFKKIPKFKDEDAERQFWSKADSTEYIDWSQARKLVLPNFRPTLRTISLRLPESMIAELKLLANQRDVPYQSLLKVFLAEKIKEERAGKGSEGSSSRRKTDGPT
jgi:predicted DNA binding CopG/RHH family protein